MAGRSLTQAVALVTLILSGCEEPKVDACPAGFRANPAHSERLKALLQGTEAARLLSADASVCFGPGPSAVTEDGVVLMESEEADEGAAARLAHLLLHVVDGSPLNLSADGTCDELVDRALRAEARAYALELRLRDALRAGFSPYTDLERAFRDRGEEGIADYLRSHPRGGPGIDGLGWAYRIRCAENRAKSAPR
ncbi:MAG: hypothetical protein AAGE52_33370 [Myxococcota bacterium]